MYAFQLLTFCSINHKPDPSSSLKAASKRINNEENLRNTSLTCSFFLILRGQRPVTVTKWTENVFDVPSVKFLSALSVKIQYYWLSGYFISIVGVFYFNFPNEMIFTVSLKCGFTSRHLIFKLVEKTNVKMKDKDKKCFTVSTVIIHNASLKI